MNGSDRKSVRQVGRETCYFCGSEGPIQTHHITPRRYDGGDCDENLVDLCPTCHDRLENLYDDEFYATIREWDPDDGRADHTLDQTAGIALIEAVIERFDDHPTLDEVYDEATRYGVGRPEVKYHAEQALAKDVAVLLADGDTPEEQVLATGRPWCRRDEDLGDQFPDALLDWCYGCENRAPTLTTEDGDEECALCGTVLNRTREAVLDGTYHPDDNDEWLRANPVQNNRKAEKEYKELITHLAAKNEFGVPVEEIHERAIEEGYTAQQSEYIFETLKQRGEVYQPRKDRWRTT